MDHLHDNSQSLIKSENQTHAGDEIATITTAPPLVAEITQNKKVYYLPCLTSSSLENLKCAS